MEPRPEEGIKPLIPRSSPSCSTAAAPGRAGTAAEGDAGTYLVEQSRCVGSSEPHLINLRRSESDMPPVLPLRKVADNKKDINMGAGVQNPAGDIVQSVHKELKHVPLLVACSPIAGLKQRIRRQTQVLSQRVSNNVHVHNGFQLRQ